jgi:hypothetical protein
LWRWHLWVHNWKIEDAFRAGQKMINQAMNLKI